MHFLTDIRTCERFLGLPLPIVYTNYLESRTSETIAGHNFLGVSGLKGPSIVEATEFLRKIRPDLPKSYIAVSFKDNLCLCLDASAGQDPRLVEVTLRENGAAITLPISFPAYRQIFEARHASFKIALQKLKNRKREFSLALPGRKRHLIRLDPPTGGKREIAGSRKEATMHSRAQDWHPRLFRLLDMVVAMSCYRYDFRSGSTEVDVFWAPDDARCKSREVITWLTASLFGEALKIAGAVNIHFTQDIREDEAGFIRPQGTSESPKRSPVAIPVELCDLANHHGVAIGGSLQGRIFHQEAVTLWLRLMGLSEMTMRRVYELEAAGFVRSDWLCHILTQGTWSREEAEWLVQNAPRPESILLATGAPENRIPFVDTLAWGRAALVTSRLIRKISLNFTGGYAPEDDVSLPDVALSTDGPFQVLRVAEPYRLPWTLDDEVVEVESDRPILLLSRPRYPLRPEWDLLWSLGEIESLARHPGRYAARCLILSMEYENAQSLDGVRFAAAERGIKLLFAQRRIDMYDSEVMERLHRIRVQRRLPSRIAPLSLRALHIPVSLWNSSGGGLQEAVHSIETFARWIGKNLQPKRARLEFTSASAAAERIVIDSTEARDLGVIDGDESIVLQNSLAAIKGSSKEVTISHVKPSEYNGFISKLPSTLAKKLRGTRGGLIFVVQPFEQAHPVQTQSLVARAGQDTSVQTNDLTVPPIDAERFAVGWWKSDIELFRQRLEEALRTGQPLAISFLRMPLFADMIHPLLRYEEVIHRDSIPRKVVTHPGFLSALFGAKSTSKIVYEERVTRSRNPENSLLLRISYSDGSEGEPLRLFDLSPVAAPTGLYKINLGTISMRHSSTDAMVAAYLMMNLEVQFRKEDGASEQETFAFHRTMTFVGDLLRAAKGGDRDALSRKDPVYSVLLEQYKIGRPRMRGLEIHLFQSTGLEPITVGVYRAMRELISQNRGEIMVVPKIVAKNPREANQSNAVPQRDHSKEASYHSGQPWF